MKIIYLLGIDGSGKTTLAKRIVKDNEDKHKFKYMYLQYFPFILKPIKLLAKKTLLKGTHEFKNYYEYHKKKKEFSNKRRRLTRLYSYIWYLDYYLQIIPKLIQIKANKETVYVVDRYYLDSIINLACLLDMDKDQILKDSRRFEKLLPRADLHFYLELDEEIAFKRKNDIQSPQYLRERKEKYLCIADEYQFVSIDASKKLDSVYSDLSMKIRQLFPSFDY
jgi:thymidylate kinase